MFGDLSHWGVGFGGFAEYVCAPETALARKPECMTFEQAAAISRGGDAGLSRPARKRAAETPTKTVDQRPLAVVSGPLQSKLPEYMTLK